MADFTLTQHSPHAEVGYLYPDGDISGCTNWLPYPNKPDYALVNENKDASDYNKGNDYIYWDIESTATEIFSFDTSSFGGTVDYVKLRVFAKVYPDGEGEDEEFQLCCSPTSNCNNIHLSEDKNLTTGWKYHDFIWSENPDTSTAWTDATINSSAFGVSGKGENVTAQLAFNDDDGGLYKGIHCYSDGIAGGGDTYTIVACGADLHLYGIGANGAINLYDTANDSGLNSYYDGYIMYYNSKYYVFATMGTDGLAAYEITGGTNLTLKDTDDQGGVYYGLWWDDDREELWVACGADGIRLYTFDGTTLTCEDTQDDGDCRDVHGTTPYVFAAMASDGLAVYRAFGTNIVQGDTIDNGGTYYGVWSNGSYPWGDDGTTIHCACSGEINAYKYDGDTGLFSHLDDYTTGGNYDSVWGQGSYVYFGCGNEGLRVFTFDGSDYSLHQTLTDAAWYYGVVVDTDNDIVMAGGGGDGIFTYVAAQVQKMYVGQMYLEVNYTLATVTCDLTKPEKISTDHARNIKMINFWNGSREVYDLNRSGKSMVLEGMEYYNCGANDDPCDRIECVRNMASNGAVITISELAPAYFNGDYRIRSFGWNYIGDKPIAVKWQLELEDNE